ncbi:glucoamylase [Candidatus Woesearchaeota archaeon]|nr:glucoamylase [Candidatus Woesearchaeota archaeon]
MINKKKADNIYKKSIEVLKKVQLRNGGCLATPKGERYPYVYPRDHAIILLGFLSAKLYKNAKKGLEFVLKTQLESGAFPQRIDQDGSDASYKPIQIDGTGLVLYSFYKYVEEAKDYDFAQKYWEQVKKAVNYIISQIYQDRYLIFTPNSIHEFPPTEAGLEIWANCICCEALFLMHDLSHKVSHRHDEWKEHAVKIKGGILKYMYNTRIKAFIKNIRVKESSSVLFDVDASQYAIADYEILPDYDPRVKSTVKRIEKELWNKDLGGLCRYPKYEGRNNGGWGPWPHFTLMIARHYIRIKNQEKADEYLKWVLDISYKDYLPEHISTVSEFEEYVHDFTEASLLRKDRLILIENARKHPYFKRKGVAYITTPLAWPHAEFIRTWNLYKQTFL